MLSASSSPGRLKNMENTVKTDGHILLEMTNNSVLKRAVALLYLFYIPMINMRG